MEFKMVNGEWVEEEIFEETSKEVKEIKKENDLESVQRSQTSAHEKKVKGIVLGTNNGKVIKIAEVDLNGDNDVKTFEYLKKEHERRQRKFDNFFTVFLGENHSSGLTLKQQHKEELRGGGNARHDWKHMKRGGKK